MLGSRLGKSLSRTTKIERPVCNIFLYVHFSKLSSLPLRTLPTIYCPELGRNIPHLSHPVSLKAGYKKLGRTSLKLPFLLPELFPSSNCIKFYTKSKARDCHGLENLSLNDILTDLDYFYSKSDFYYQNGYFISFVGATTLMHVRKEAHITKIL